MGGFKIVKKQQVFSRGEAVVGGSNPLWPTSEFFGDLSSKNQGDVRGSNFYKNLTKLSKWQLEYIRKASSVALRDKYDRTFKEPKYGNLQRSMRDEQLIKFFINIRNKEIKKAFLIQFFYALRVGEIAEIETFPEQGIIKVKNKKCDRVDYLPLYAPIDKLIIGFKQKNTYHYLRKAFRRIRMEADLGFSYGESTTERPLYQFTTHSLRHTAINIFGNYIRDPVKINIFSRHKKQKDIGVMATYRYYGLDELRKDLEKVFKKYEFLLEL